MRDVCDTLVALPDATKGRVTIFAKNSDREPNEAQILEFHPRMRHDEGYVKCTYIEVPQVRETYAVLISRPFWMWGAEMGVNEWGLAIGNEAVFTREPYRRTGLTGMDMLRLALERCRTAREAVNLIVELLEKYGQGGNCGYTRRLYYHNSFLIADPGEAWVLETAGDYWAAKRVEGVRSISNALTIGRDWDLAHLELVDHAVEKGWCRGEEDFSFANCYSDRLYTRLVKGRERQRYTQRMLEDRRGSIDLAYVMRIMRSHYSDPDFKPSKGSMRDICMHAGGPTRPSQTAGSQISLLYEKVGVHWFTATSTPCISLYKPVFIEAGLPDLGPEPKGTYDPRTVWWRHETLHRKLMCSYAKYAGELRRKIEVTERELVKETMDARARYLEGDLSKDSLLELSRNAFKMAEELEKDFIERVKPGSCLNPLFKFYWWRINRQAKFSIHHR